MWTTEKKIKIVMSWVKETTDDNIIIGAESLTDVYTWTDAA